jgi:Putative auto-transporter adhesin, head GIN domain
VAGPLPSVRGPSEGGVSDRRPRSLLAFAVLGLAIALVGCGFGGVTGSGPTTVEARSVDPFTGVEVSNGIGLTLHAGAAQSVEVSAETNILPLITTTVEGGVLKIRSTGSFTTSVGVSVTVSVPELAVLSVSGGSHAQVDGLTGSQLSIDVSGGAVLVATGRAMDVTLSSSGGARADLAALAAKTTSVDLSGGATAALNVSDQVTGSASGGAVATVVGGAKVNVQTSGGARVTSD